VSLKGKLVHATNENTILVQDVAYLTSRLERTKLSEKMIEEDLSRVDECVTHSIHKHGLSYERCEEKGEIFIKFVPSCTYNDEEETLKAKQISYPPNSKPSFNSKRAQKQITNSYMPNLDGVYTCMFCGHTGHLDKFCFQYKRIERGCVEYARDSYRDELFDLPPHSYSRVLPRSYSRASSRTFLRALPQFAYEPNHHSYGLGSRENRFVPRCFGYGPRPHRGDHFLHRSGFTAGGAHTHFEPRHLDSPHFFRRGSRPTRPNGKLQRIVKIPSGHMVKCWIPKIYLTHPSTETSTPSRPM
jgi:hypothetical protein